MSSLSYITTRKDTLLKPGITNHLIDVKKRIYPPDVNVDKFKSIAHGASQRFGNRFLDFNGQYPDNYYLAWFSDKYNPERLILGFLNRYYPFLAFSPVDLNQYDSFDENGVPNRFKFSGYRFDKHDIYHDIDFTMLFQYKYRLLDLEELREPLSFQNTHDKKKISLDNPHELRHDEITEIHQRRVKTVAQVIYNWWD